MHSHANSLSAAWSRGQREEAAPIPWASMQIRERIRRVCSLRHALADRSAEFLAALGAACHRPDAQSVAGELIPLADACAFLEKRAAKLLRPVRLGRNGRPVWLSGTAAEIHREPLGEVLIIGPANYPLMLPGIQIAQALVAGNRVLFKPAPGTRRIASLLCETLHAGGVPLESLVLLNEEASAVQPWLGRVDKVVMTGSEASGKAVLRQLAEHVVPAVMELSGCDAAFVLEGADVERAVAALRFGLTFNQSATCMAPRRVFVHEPIADRVVTELAASLRGISCRPSSEITTARLSKLGNDALAAGATLASGSLLMDGAGPWVFDHADPGMQLLQEDLMAPFLSVVRVSSPERALAAYQRCRYQLGASVFGPEPAARAFAQRIPAGSVVVNDLIVPTADPRLPLGARRSSGFGVTRGAEGLLEMTRVKSISVRRGGRPSHLRPDAENAGPLLLAYLRAAHGRGLVGRLKSIFGLMREGKKMFRARSDKRSTTSSDPQQLN